jgi:general secretion pathway protein I
MAGRRSSIQGRQGNGGFTLLEVLLAFLVFALSFATVLEIMSGSIRSTVRAREYTEAALIAQSVMDQLGLEILVEHGVSASGESGDHQWELDIGAYEPGPENTHSVELGELTGIELLQIDLVVSTGEPPRDKSHYFSTVRAMLVNREPGGG